MGFNYRRFYLILEVRWQWTKAHIFEKSIASEKLLPAERRGNNSPDGFQGQMAAAADKRILNCQKPISEQHYKYRRFYLILEVRWQWTKAHIFEKSIASEKLLPAERRVKNSPDGFQGQMAAAADKRILNCQKPISEQHYKYRTIANDCERHRSSVEHRAYKVLSYLYFAE